MAACAGRMDVRWGHCLLGPRRVSELSWAGVLMCHAVPCGSGSTLTQSHSDSAIAV